MPNRNARNEEDRYDHSSHSTRRREQGDLKAAPVGRAGEQTLPNQALPKRTRDSSQHAPADTPESVPAGTSRSVQRPPRR